MTLLLGVLLLGGLVLGCGGAEPSSVSLAPAAAGDGWKVSTPEAQGMDPDRLAGMFRHVEESPEHRTVHSLLVVRNGFLVAEGYFGDGSRTRLNDVRSVTKSVTSLLVGIALEKRFFRGMEERFVRFLPEYVDEDDAPRRSITLENLLTMRSGLRWDERAHGGLDPGGLSLSGDSVRYVLQHPVREEPGKVFRYSTGDSQLVAAMLWRATGLPPVRFAARHLFRPLGITRFRWDAHPAGLSYGGMRLFLTARDMAKIGQMCLDRGAWEGRQIVPASWIETSTREHVRASDSAYGYYWWIRPDGYTAQGWGGQYIYVLPEERVVLVMTADPTKKDRHIHFGPVEEMIERFVLGSL
jgi:CubicO group peptidase (beta-lactamase class C family)